MAKGLFITFEGIDGCGKTTQMNLLKEYLEKQGKKVVTTFEPGGNDAICKKIRELLLHTKCNISPKCELFLFLADRAQHINCFVKENLKQGAIILCDRHVDSTLAYQGFGRDGNIEQLKLLNDIATDSLKSDLTFLFDIDVELANSRLGKSKDRMESEGVAFLKKVKDGYLQIANEQPQRIKVLRGDDSICNLHKEIVATIEEKYFL